MAYSCEHVRTASVKSSVEGKEVLYSMNSGSFFSTVHCMLHWLE